MTDYGALALEISDGSVVPLVVDAPHTGTVCPNCNGLGAVYAFRCKSGGPYKSPMNVGDKWLSIDGKAGWYSGKLVQQPCPACSNGQLATWLADHCGLVYADLAVSLYGFNTEGDLAGKEPARLAAASLLAMNTVPAGFVTYWGNYGCGKSHLLKALVNGFRKVSVFARYTVMADLLEEIKSKFADKDSSRAAANVIAACKDIRVLCLDEFERINLTDWAAETVFRLLDARYNDRGRLLTVLSSNINPEDLPEEWGYIRSRIFGGQVVEVPGPDMRQI
jgi:hypothetical protein